MASPHPAKVLVTTCFTRIRRALPQRKLYQQLSDEIKWFLEHIDAIFEGSLVAHQLAASEAVAHPPPSPTNTTAPGTPGQQEDAGGSRTLGRAASLGEEKQPADEAASDAGAGAAAAEGEADTHDVSATQEDDRGEAAAGDEGTPDTLSTQRPQTTTTATTTAQTQQQLVDGGSGHMPSPSTPVRVGATTHAASQHSAASTPGPTGRQPQDGQQHHEASASASAPASRASALPFHISPPPPALPDLVTRTDAALSDALTNAILHVLRQAVATRRAPAVEPALDCVQKLIAHRFLQGTAYAIGVEPNQPGVGDKNEPATADPSTLSPQAHAVELICRADEVADEGVELLVLKALLTASCSGSFTLHGPALLLGVRTAYNIFLITRSDANQTTARACLTQMLAVVFARLEANAVGVRVAPVAVADVVGVTTTGALAPAGASGSTPAAPVSGDAATIIAAVQRFVNAVVMTASGQGGGGGQQQPAPPASLIPSTVSVSAAAVAARGPPQAATTADSQPNTPPANAQAASVKLATEKSLNANESEDEDEHFRLGGNHDKESSAVATHTSTEPSFNATLQNSAQAAHERSAVATPGAAAAVTQVDASEERVRASILQKDAFLVFRALCKMSIRTGSTEGSSAQETPSLAGKLLALGLVKILLENSGPIFRTHDRFVVAIRQHLCLSLLKNSASTVPQVLNLSASIFLSLILHFRQSIKAETGVFFPMIFLKPLEPPAHSTNFLFPLANTSLPLGGYLFRSMVLRYLRDICSDGQLLVDLFVNFDCDLESSNLYERLLQGLLRLAQAKIPEADMASQQVLQENLLKQEALLCTITSIEALLSWFQRSSGQAGDIQAAAADEEPSAADEGAGVVGGRTSTDDGDIVDVTGTVAGSDVYSKRAFKIKFQQGQDLFNRKPKKGIEFLLREGVLRAAPEEIAHYLSKTEGLDKTRVGEYLGDFDDTSIRVMHAYVDAMDFSSIEFDDAIRTFLQGFRLPGEAQKIDRLMEKFAERYVKCNPSSFKSADVAYVLGYSVIMLNTDAHNPQVKNKMDKAAFLKNNRGIDDGADLPEEFMSTLYDRIVTNEIKMKDDATSATPEATGRMDEARKMLLTLLNIVGAQKPQVETGPSEDAIRRTLDSLHLKAQGATFFTAADPETVGPMMEVIWAPLLGALSVLFDEYNDPRLLSLCLRGFSAGACLTAKLGAHNLKDIFMNSLCSFTHLHTPRNIQTKHGLAFSYLLQVARLVGDHLRERWIDVLRCISRWELLQQMASGVPTDATLFSFGQPGAPQQQFRQERASKGSGLALQQTFKKLHLTPGHVNVDNVRDNQEALTTSLDSLSMNEFNITRGPKGVNQGHYGDASSISNDVIEIVDSSEINKVFVASARLDSEAVVQFVKALAAISLDELKDASSPRIFSLTKIVEIAHYNMTRVSLRQLAMKFLERDELANYTFQNDFLRPFVVVMRQSQAVEIRELIIRCLSQMVLARVSNVRSGWKSMFMVFTTAAVDVEPNIVRLAFDTIEKIVREHFDHITETETRTFTDCVNCLIAFTNNPHSLDVALNSIAFIRFCAVRLGEGKIGTSNLQADPDVSISTTSGKGNCKIPSSEGGNVEKGTPGKPATGALKDDHVYFWFPLLAGLSELSFDPRPEVRYSALEVLFDILRFHGATFEDSFWRRIFDSVLLPIFDHVRAEISDTTSFTNEKRRQQEDSWLYETCTQCLQHLIDLFVQFYSVVKMLLPKILQLLDSFIQRGHQSLASVGVAAFVRLLTKGGHLMDEEAWMQSLDFLSDTVTKTRPSAADLLMPMPRPSLSPAPSPRANGTAESQVRGQATLREGIGARRLATFQTNAAIQVLLIQAGGVIYEKQHLALAARPMQQLLNSMQIVAEHATNTNMQLDLRQTLQNQQTVDRVPESRQVGDPPLLKLEAEACLAYLSILVHLSTKSADTGVQDVCEVDNRILKICKQIFQRFTLGLHAASDVSNAPSTEPSAGRNLMVNKSRRFSMTNSILGASAAEYYTLAPLTVAALQAIKAFDDGLVYNQTRDMYPQLIELIRCNYVTPSVQRALSTLILQKFQPVVDA